MHIAQNPIFKMSPSESRTIQVDLTTVTSVPMSPMNTPQTLRPASPSSSLLPSSSSSSSPTAMTPLGEGVDSSNKATNKASQMPCFWALMADNDLRFVYVSPSTLSSNGSNTGSDSNDNRYGTMQGITMPDAAAAEGNLRKVNQRPTTTMAVDALCSPHSLPSEPNSLGTLLHEKYSDTTVDPTTEMADNSCDRDAYSRSQKIHQRVNHYQLLNTSFFDHLHPEEVTAARADLAHYVAQKTLYGTMTRCRFRVPETIDTRNSEKNAHSVSKLQKFDPSPHLTVPSTVSMAKEMGGSSTHDTTWAGAPVSTISPFKPVSTHTAYSSTMGDTSLCPTQDPMTCSMVSSTHNNRDASKDEFVVMEVTMSVVCGTLTLAFFHVVGNGGSDVCSEKLSTVEDIVHLERLLIALSTAKSHPPTNNMDDASMSTRVLQILSTKTGSLLLAHPAENLRRLAADTVLPDRDTQDWLGHLYHKDDYRKLRAQMVGASKAAAETHGAAQPVCSRLRLQTSHGYRMTESVVTTWAGLTFVCTQLANSELEPMTCQTSHHQVGETQWVTPMGLSIVGGGGADPNPAGDVNPFPKSVYPSSAGSPFPHNPCEENNVCSMQIDDLLPRRILPCPVDSHLGLPMKRGINLTVDTPSLHTLSSSTATITASVPPLTYSGGIDTGRQTSLMPCTPDNTHFASGCPTAATMTKMSDPSLTSHPPTPVHLCSGASQMTHLSQSRQSSSPSLATLAQCPSAHPNYSSSSATGLMDPSRPNQHPPMQTPPSVTLPHSLPSPFRSSADVWSLEALSANGSIVDGPERTHVLQQTRPMQRRPASFPPHASSRSPVRSLSATGLRSNVAKSGRVDLLPPDAPFSSTAGAVLLSSSATSVRQRDFPGPTSTEEKQCESCGTTRSPEWRRGPSGHKTLCNACGLRYSRSLARAGKAAAQIANNPAQLYQHKQQQLLNRFHPSQHSPSQHGYQHYHQHHRHRRHSQPYSQPSSHPYPHPYQMHQSYVMSPPLSTHREHPRIDPSSPLQHGTYPAPQHWLGHSQSFDPQVHSSRLAPHVP